jgi:hypothetical protein
MTWILVAIGYIIAVVAIIRFFQSVSDRDRTIERFWTDKKAKDQTIRRKQGRKVVP